MLEKCPRGTSGAVCFRYNQAHSQFKLQSPASRCRANGAHIHTHRKLEARSPPGCLYLVPNSSRAAVLIFFNGVPKDLPVHSEAAAVHKGATRPALISASSPHSAPCLREDARNTHKRCPNKKKSNENQRARQDQTAPGERGAVAHCTSTRKQSTTHAETPSSAGI